MGWSPAPTPNFLPIIVWFHPDFHQWVISRSCSPYPLLNIQKAMENGWKWPIYSWFTFMKIVIFQFANCQRLSEGRNPWIWVLHLPSSTSMEGRESPSAASGAAVVDIGGWRRSTFWGHQKVATMEIHGNPPLKKWRTRIPWRFQFNIELSEWKPTYAVRLSSPECLPECQRHEKLQENKSQSQQIDLPSGNNTWKLNIPPHKMEDLIWFNGKLTELIKEYIYIYIYTTYMENDCKHIHDFPI